MKDYTALWSERERPGASSVSTGDLHSEYINTFPFINNYLSAHTITSLTIQAEIVSVLQEYFRISLKQISLRNWTEKWLEGLLTGANDKWYFTVMRSSNGVYFQYSC